MTLCARIISLFALFIGCSAAWAEGVTPFADVLVWHASEETSSVWASTITTASSSQTFTADNVQFDWNAGFRVGLTYASAEDAWDMKWYWTRFRSTAHAVCPPGDHAIVPEFFSGFVSGDAGIFNSATLDWSLAFDTIDWEMGRSIDIGESWTVRPYLGLQGAIIEQEIHANWISSRPLLGLSAAEHVDHDFWGLGPVFGIDGRWKVTPSGNLSIVGSCSAALLWGVWDVDDRYQRTDGAFPLLTYGSFTTSMHDSSLGTLNLHYFFGLEWNSPGDVTITGRLGYELQWWANQQRLPTFQQLPMHGDLALQGLTCGITVGF